MTMTGWREHLLWRQYILWSYRVDLFLIVLISYTIILICLAGVYIYYAKSKEPELHETISKYKDSVATFRSILDVASERSLTDEELQRLSEISFYRANTDMASAYLRYRALEVLTDRERENYLRDLLPTYKTEHLTPEASYIVNKKVDEMVDFELSAADLPGSYSLLHRLFTSAWGTFLLLPVVIMGYLISNVFNSQGIRLTIQHPIFPISLMQLSFLVIWPLTLMIPVESIINLTPLVNEAMHRNYEATTWTALFQGYTPSGGRERYFAGSFLVLIMGALFWIAAGLWSVRQFGWGVFFSCSVFCAALFVGVLLLTEGLGLPPEVSRDVPIFSIFGVWVWGVQGAKALILVVIICAIIFSAGVYISARREYLWCAGYLGLVVFMPFLGVVFTAYSASGLSSVIVVVGLVVSLAVIVEFILRRAMLKLMAEPR